jgi:hypothetical protein
MAHLSEIEKIINAITELDGKIRVNENENAIIRKFWWD